MNYRRLRGLTGFATALLCALPVTANASVNTLDHQQLAELANDYCEIFASTPATQLVEAIVARTEQVTQSSVTHEAQDIEMRGRALGVRIDLQTPLSQPFNVQLITPPMQPVRTVVTSYLPADPQAAELQLVLNADCVRQQARQLYYNDSNKPLYSQQLTPDTLQAAGSRQWISPPVPPLAPIQPPRFRVAMIDSGVNYLLPHISRALARDDKGELIGYDFWDMDNEPFDAHPTRSPFQIQRHGTRTTSIVIREAPGIAIVPYRYPRPDMSRMQALIEHASENKVRIIGMPLGGNRFDEWATFQRAAESHPEILFIASAGNNGRDIDRRGVYPAALEIDNMLVVTSSDDFVKPAERTNYGRIAVDYLLPAENITATDYDGSTQPVSGSSYAVSRLVALAARILNRTPTLTTDELKHAISKHSVRANSGRYVAIGYLGDPQTDPSPLGTRNKQITPQPAKSTAYSLPVNIYVLNDKWSDKVIEGSLAQARTILAQCDIQLTTQQWLQVSAPEYLQDLSTGHALTLKRKLGMQGLSVVYANDTIMATQFDAEAFGAGNTANRPWMRNSLWLTAVTEDLGIAVAHELFHILTNNGNHTDTLNNLMQQRTDPNNTLLTGEQCSAAIEYASNEQLVTTH